MSTPYQNDKKLVSEHEIVFQDAGAYVDARTQDSNVEGDIEIPRSIALGHSDTDADADQHGKTVTGNHNDDAATLDDFPLGQTISELTLVKDEESGLATSPSGDSSGDNSGGEKKHRMSLANDKENNKNRIEDGGDGDDEEDDHIRAQRMGMLKDAHNAQRRKAGGATSDGQQPAQCHATHRRQTSSLPCSTETRRRRKIARALKNPRKFLRDIREDDADADFDYRDDDADNSSLDHAPKTHQQQHHPASGPTQSARFASGTRNIMQTTHQNNTQYKLTAHHKSHNLHGGSSCGALLSCLGCQTWGTIYDDAAAGGASGYCNPNQVVMNYLHWSFRSSFAAVFLSACVAFLVLTLLFAVVLWGIGQPHPTCIGGVDFETDYFTDAFVLSWTTFSTVGYGLIYSGISADESDIRKCTGITIVVTIEAFVGVLFASFCGAIVFAKVNRAQSYAQVSFSDPLVIRFGSGILIEEDQEEEDQNADDIARKKKDGKDGTYQSSDDDDSNSSGSKQQIHYPCPVLEFRIVNRLSTIAGGEILDAVVNIVASVDASQRTIIPPGLRRRRGLKGKKRPIRQERPAQKPKPVRKPREMSAAEREAALSDQREFMASVKALLEETSNARDSMRGGLVTGNTSHRQSSLLPTHQAFEEDPTGHLVPRRVFAKVEVETQDHPFLKRIWTVRHRLDERSPLLQTPVRDMIQANGGFWPPELNHAAGVRKAVQFDQILVSLSGTSNADANPVYTQKVYEYVDVSVGYRLANMLYRDEYTGNLRVDMRLISDVTEQAGPDRGEPLHASREITLGDELEDMLIL